MPNSIFTLTAHFILSIGLICTSTSSLSKANIEFDLSKKFSSSQQANLKQWLTQGLSAVEQTIAPLPLSELRFTVIKHHNNNHPVPWGQIVRGTRNAVKLHVAPKASLEALNSDWTLYHELSHLYLPYIEHSSFWLGEGFASYMQYIIMYQAGELNRALFIKNIKAGFERGKRKTLTTPGELKDVTENMWQLRAYRRVYWSGAAFFLEADLALQNNGQSLSAVMSEYTRCCITDYSTGQALVKQLDRISKSQTFVSLFHKYSKRTDFPTITNQQLNAVADFYAN